MDKQTENIEKHIENMKKMFSLDTLDYLDRIIAAHFDKTLSDDERFEIIRTCFLASFLQDADRAKKYVALRNNADNSKTEEVTNGILEALGQMINANLKMYKKYGATYKMLVSVINADYEKAAEIETNGDTELSFDELILKYELADKAYPEVKEALLQFRNRKEK